jgi:hypothetical protein
MVAYLPDGDTTLTTTGLADAIHRTSTPAMRVRAYAMYEDHTSAPAAMAFRSLGSRRHLGASGSEVHMIRAHDTGIG